MVKTKPSLETTSAVQPPPNNYSLYDSNGTLIETKTFPTANTVYTYTYQEPQIGDGCYRLRVNDSGKDGLQWWANTSQGTGYMRLLDANDVIIKTFNPDFGGGFDYSFSVNSLLSNTVLATDNDIKVYPNPSYGNFSVAGKELNGATITVIDILGNVVMQQLADNDAVNFNSIQLSTGVYFVKIQKDKNTVTKKLIIN